MPDDVQKKRDELMKKIGAGQSQPAPTQAPQSPKTDTVTSARDSIMQKLGVQPSSLGIQPLPAYRGNFQVPTGSAQITNPNPMDFIDTWRQQSYPQQFQGDQFVGGQGIIGPGGESLPKNALGWDFYGEPYFGEGMEGWWEKIKSKVAEPETQVDWDKEKYIGENLGMTWDQNKYVTQNIWENLKKVGKAAESGSFSRGLGSAIRYTQAGVTGVLDLFNEPSEKLEQALAAGSYVAESTIYDTVNSMYGGGEKGAAMGKLAVGLASIRNLTDLDSLVRYMNSPTPNYNLLSQLDGDNWNITEGGLPLVKPGSELDTAWKSGKMLYTAAIAPLSYEEAKRRIQAGEDPTLVVNELQNPWAEAGGQLLLDPLNIVGPFKMKALQGDKRIRNAVELQNASTDLVNSMGDFGRFQQVNSSEVAKVANGLDNLSTRYNIATLTPGGKRFVATQHVSNYLDWLLHNSDDPAAGLKALVYSVSKNPDELRYALDFAQNQPGGNSIFGRAGREAGLVLREMLVDDTAKVARGAKAPKMDRAGKALTGKALEKATARMAKYQEAQAIGGSAQGARRLVDFTDIPIDPAKFLDDLEIAQKEGPEAVLSLIVKKTDKAIEALFPSVKQREEAIKLIKAGEDVPDELRVAARQYEAGFRNNPLTRMITKQDAMLQKGIFGPLNRFFANVYMGASPGYAARNVMNNMMTSIIDVGWGSATPRSLEQAYKDYMDLSGGTLAQGAKGGYGTGAVFTGQEVAKFHKTIGESFKRGGFRGMSEIAENWSAVNIMTTSFKDSMLKLVQKGYPDIRPLVEAGVDEASARGLLRRLMSNNYDVAKTVNEFKVELGSGKISVFKEMGWVPNNIKATLLKMNMDSMLNDIVQNSTDAKGVRKGFSDWRSNLFKEIEKTADEIPVISDTTSPMAEDAARITEAVENGYVDEVQGIYYAHHTEQNSRAINTYQDSVRGLLDKYMGQIPKALADKALDYLQKKVATRLALDTQRKRDLTWRLNDASFREGFDIRAAMNQLVQEGFRPISGMPETPKQFRRVLHGEFYKGMVRKNWQDYRDQYAMNGEVLLREFQTALKQQKVDISPNVMNKARMELARAETWDDFIDTNDVKVAIAHALDRNDLAQCARIYANQFGIASATASGIPLDKKILTIINKVQEAKGDAAFQRLSEVPEEVSHTNLYSYVMSKAKPKTDAEIAAAMPPDELTILKGKVVSSKPGYVPYTIDPSDVELRDFTDQVYSNPEAHKKLWSRFKGYAHELTRQLREGEFIPAHWEGDIQDLPSDIVIGADYSLMEELESRRRFVPMSSTNPRWWTNMKEKYGVSNPTKGKTMLYLQQISEGTVDTSLKSVQALIDEMVSQMLDPEVGDPIVMLEYGLERSAFDRLTRLVEEGYSLDNIVDPDDLQRAYDLLDKNPYELADKYQAGTIDKFFFNEYSALAEKYLPKKMPKTAAPVETPPTAARVIAENKDGLISMLNQLEEKAVQNFDQYRPAFIDRSVEGAVSQFQKALENTVAESRLVSTSVAEEARKFALLSYPEKRYFDLALAYIYPYQFWYSRSYANWLQRLAYNPEIIAAYAKYRTALERVHAGAPDWWKYQVSTNELLGIDMENPLFFNLEATLNPLNGLTGVDFNDPDRRQTWYASLIDDLGKFGPSVWTPYQWATALALLADGEKDAARRFAGRIIPQTSAIRSGLSLVQQATGTDAFTLFGGVNELDPFIWLQGGTDPYEERRIGRALSEINAPPEQLLEAARTHDGPLWYQAAELALRKRAPGNISSFLLGVGFKARSMTDMQIDQFDKERRVLMASKGMFATPDAYAQAWEDLKNKYSFADVVTLSRGKDAERDEAYVYNVFSRLPPGNRDDLLKAVGGDTMPELMTRFYNAKGDMSGWAETDRQRFMASIVDLGAMLKLPDAATKQEWKAATKSYNTMRTEAERTFGPDIWTTVDGYFTAKKQGLSAGNQYLEDHPEVGQVLDWKASYTASDPVYAQYYAAIDDIYRYYTNVMYDKIISRVGNGIWQEWDEYNDAKLTGDQKQYWADHPNLQTYVDLKAQYLKDIARTVLKTADNLRLPTYAAVFREPISLGQEAATEAMVPEPTFLDVTWEDINQEMTPALQRLVVDSLMTGEPMEWRVEEQFDNAAERLGLEPAVLEELMKRMLLAR